jgi:beta-galactosidase
MWSYQGIAHGCDSLMYFRYRGATKGAEQFCYGIIDADNVKRRKFYEVQDFFQTIGKYADVLEKPIKAEAAILYDYDSLAAFRIQRQSILLDCQNEMKKIYKAFFDKNVPVDVIPARHDFSHYKIIVLPQMIITNPAVKARVEQFAADGGTVVMTYRTAVKDMDNNVPFGETAPVGYNAFAGVKVVETESLQSFDAFPLTGKGAFSGSEGVGGIFRDMLEVDGAEVLYAYGDAFYRDFAAVTRKACGSGMVYYIGCGLEEKLSKKIFETIMADNGVETVETPAGVELVTRGDETGKIRILINHNEQEAAFGEMVLKPFECRVLEG